MQILSFLSWTSFNLKNILRINRKFQNSNFGAFETFGAFFLGLTQISSTVNGIEFGKKWSSPPSMCKGVLALLSNAVAPAAMRCRRLTWLQCAIIHCLSHHVTTSKLYLTILKQEKKQILFISSRIHGNQIWTPHLFFLFSAPTSTSQYDFF